MSDTELAWCAGIVDGEGTITLTRNATDFTPRIMVTMTDLETIEALHRRMSLGKIRSDLFAASSNHKYKHFWQANGTNAKVACELLLPYLVTKRKQADLLLEYFRDARSLTSMTGTRKVTQEVLDKRNEVGARMRELNRRGGDTRPFVPLQLRS